MTLPDGDKEPSRTEVKVCVTVLAVLRRRSNRVQPGPGGFPDLLVISADEPEGTIGGQVGAATVFMDVGRDRHTLRQDILHTGQPA